MSSVTGAIILVYLFGLLTDNQHSIFIRIKALLMKLNKLIH